MTRQKGVNNMKKSSITQEQFELFKKMRQTGITRGKAAETLSYSYGAAAHWDKFASWEDFCHFKTEFARSQREKKAVVSQVPTSTKPESLGVRTLHAISQQTEVLQKIEQHLSNLTLNGHV